MSTAIPTSELAEALRAHGFTGRLVEPVDPGYDAPAPAGTARSTAGPPPSPTPPTPRTSPPRSARPAPTASPSRSAAAGTRSPGARCATARCASTCAALDAVAVDPRARRRARRRRRAARRDGRGHAGARPRRPGGPDLAHRRRRAHARRRHRLADAPPRADDRLARRAPRSCSPTGSIVRASADEHPDLFWALRGGGGDFGVVTELRVPRAPRRADRARGHARLPVGARRARRCARRGSSWPARPTS